MRVFEFITEDKIATTSGVDIFSREKQISDTPGSEKLGSGVDAVVYSNPKSKTGQETATKLAYIAFNDPKFDGYYNYIKTLMRLKRVYNNPYLPQIYNAKVVKSKKGLSYLEVELPKLEPVDNLSKEELLFILEKILDHKFASDEELSYFIFGDESFGGGDQYDLLRVLHHIFTYSAQSPYYKRNGLGIKDKNLIEALKIIRKLLKQDFHLDLNTGNFMVRRTPYGPQLVFTDPLQYKSISTSSV